MREYDPSMQEWHRTWVENVLEPCSSRDPKLEHNRVIAQSRMICWSRGSSGKGMLEHLGGSSALEQGWSWSIMIECLGSSSSSLRFSRPCFVCQTTSALTPSKILGKVGNVSYQTYT